ALRKLVQPLGDSTVGAVSGNTKVGNRGGLLGRWQHIEYVTGFNLDRRMYEVLQCTPTVPGAIGSQRSAASPETRSPKTPTSRSRSAAPVDACCTQTTLGHGPRLRLRSE